MKSAFHRGTRPSLAGIYNRLVRWWTRSEFSHVELDLIDLPPEFEQAAVAAALGIPEPWRYAPGTLASTLTLLSRGDPGTDIPQALAA